MFWKKKCKVCGSKIEKSYDFCPHCGSSLKEKQGLLDEIDEMNEDNGFGFGMNMGSLPFDKILNQAMKELPSIMKSMEEQMKGEGKKQAKSNPSMNFRLVVNGEEIMPMQIPKIQQIPKQKEFKKFNKEQQVKMEKLQKTEPQTSVRRLANKVIYEIVLPGVKEKDVIINKLQNSIEVKALAKDRIFLKLIPVSLPIIRHSLKNGKLVLELRPEA